MLVDWELCTSLKLSIMITSLQSKLRALLQVSIPPNVWLDATNVATLEMVYYPGFVLNSSVPWYVVPLAHTQPPTPGGKHASEGAWLKNRYIRNMTAWTAQGNVVNLEAALADPLLAQMIAGSSSAYGPNGSPDMVNPVAGPVGDNSSFGKCNPAGLETLAAPILKPGYTFPVNSTEAKNATLKVEDVLYRQLDGAYTDNTNAAMMLAQMQAECFAGKGDLDCSSGVYKLIITGCFFATNLWYYDDLPPGSYGPQNGPVPTIFAQPPPTDVEWKPYASVAHDPSPTKGKAYYWAGKQTTVDNTWYGVQGGSVVEVLYLTTARGPLNVPGRSATEIFERVLAPATKVEGEGAAPIIAAFLDGSLFERERRGPF